MPTVHFDPDGSGACTSLSHDTEGRGPARVTVDGAGLCIFEAHKLHGVDAWSSHILTGNQRHGVTFLTAPADLGTYQGPATFQSLKTNDFDRNTTYDFLAAIDNQRAETVWLSVRATGADLRSPSFRNDVAVLLDEMCVTLSKSDRADVLVYWRAV